MREELKAAFSGRSFLMSFLLMFITLFAYSIPLYIWQNVGEPGWPNAFQLTVEPVFFGGVILVFPFCAVMAYAISQVTEILTGFLPMKVLRSSVSRVCISKATASAVAGGAAPMLAFALVAVIWNTLAVPVDPVQFSHHEITFSEGVVYQEWYQILHGLPMYASICAGMFLTGCVWAVIGLAAATWMPDKLFSVMFVNVIYTIWIYNFPRLLFDIRMPTPEALFNDGLTSALAINSLICNTIVFVIAYAVYWLGMRRRFGRA